MKNSLALTAALTGLAVQIVLAQTSVPLIPAKLNVVVPKGPMQLGALVLRKTSRDTSLLNFFSMRNRPITACQSRD